MGSERACWLLSTQLVALLEEPHRERGSLVCKGDRPTARESFTRSASLGTLQTTTPNPPPTPCIPQSQPRSPDHSPSRERSQEDLRLLKESRLEWMVECLDPCSPHPQLPPWGFQAELLGRETFAERPLWARPSAGPVTRVDQIQWDPL